LIVGPDGGTFGRGTAAPNFRFVDEDEGGFEALAFELADSDVPEEKALRGTAFDIELRPPSGRSA